VDLFYKLAKNAFRELKISIVVNVYRLCAISVEISILTTILNVVPVAEQFAPNIERLSLTKSTFTPNVIDANMGCVNPAKRSNIFRQKNRENFAGPVITKTRNIYAASVKNPKQNVAKNAKFIYVKPVRIIISTRAGLFRHFSLFL
jgi:hypothetical protein